IANGLKIYEGENLYFGRVGVPCVALISGKTSISPNIIIAEAKSSKADCYYLYSYLSSSYGLTQLKRQLKEVAQPTTSTEAVKGLLVYEPHLSVQKYIGNKVRCSELIRQECLNIDEELAGKIQTVVRGSQKPIGKIYTKQSADFITPNRLDPKYYSLVSLWSEFEVVQGPYEHHRLGDLTLRIKDGPGGWGVSTNDYKPHGVPVIRSVNIIDGECDLTDCVYISEDKHQELIGHQAKKGSVVLSVRGTVGRAAVFDTEGLESASLNAAVVTIDCKENRLNPYFLAAFFNSTVGNTQANRIANGAVQLNMNLTETASNLIPLPPIEVQEDIERVYRKLIVSRQLSRNLLSASKLLVEALIEGKITEAELNSAQQALDIDDNTKDKAILSKLTEKGYAIEDAKPLFSNLEELYEILEEAQQEKEQG
ncbi:restriction endonuclease subunit S, partial [Vibrio tubiashii]